MIYRTRIMPRMAFTLLELSVVLVIISLLAGMGISLSRNINSGSDRITTQQRLQAIQSALDTYEQQFGYLPCPASRSNIPTDDAFGVEQRIPSPGAAPAARCDTTTSPALTVVPNATTPSIYIGAVPTQSLGLPANYAADAWGNKFLYAVSYNHVVGQDSYFDYDGPITINYGDRTNNYPITTTRGTNADNYGSTPAGAGAVYVVLSHGPDGKGGYPLNSTAVAVACPALASDNSIDDENCDDSNTIFYDSDYNDSAPGQYFFDDYIVWSSNKLSRAPVPLATAGYGGYAGTLLGTGCTPGVCEAWCAPCFNQPVFTPDPSVTPPMQIYVCQSSITSVAPNCSAKCVYGYIGVDSSGVSHNVPCL